MEVADEAGATDSQALSITINQPPAITTTSLPIGMVGELYGATLMADFGTSPLSWAVTGGDWPNGLNLGADGNISGTPTLADTFVFTVEVTDYYGVADSQVLSIEIVPWLEIDSVVVSEGAGGDSGLEGTIDVFYSVTPQATGGRPPYVSWEVTAGSLPSDLTLNSNNGEISGTPRLMEEQTFTLQVTDSLGFTGNVEMTIKMNDRPMVTTTLLPDGYANVFYPDVILDTTGGTGALTFAVVKGKLPAGLSLDVNSGVISGTPSRATRGGQPVTFTVEVTDSLGAAQSPEVTITIFK